MGRVRSDVHVPDPPRAKAYDELYAVYTRLHDHFGREERGLMRTLTAMRERAAQ
jgi:L-ribulokinase